MAELITYPIKVSVCMILLYGLYVLALKKGTHFRFNRIYLLASIYISLILPLLNITLYSSHAEAGFAGILQTVQVKPNTVFNNENGISSAYAILMIYLAGVIILSASFISKLISLIAIRKQCIFDEIDGQKIAYCKKRIAPFSFFSTIYIDENMINDKQLDKIIMHENIHIQELHSLDIIFAEIICLLTWFNPVSWMIKSALKETHEYQADSGVSKQTGGHAEYFLLLIRNAIGMQPGLANNFNKSLT